MLTSKFIFAFRHRRRNCAKIEMTYMENCTGYIAAAPINKDAKKPKPRTGASPSDILVSPPGGV